MNSLPEPAHPQVAPAAPANDMGWNAPVDDVDWGAVASRLYNLPWAKIGLFSVKAVFWALTACAALVVAVGTVCVQVLALIPDVDQSADDEDKSSEHYTCDQFFLDASGNIVTYDTGTPAG